jgi:hypothetical protein
MKLSKHDALALAKVLHAHGVGGPLAGINVEKTEHQETLEYLAERLDEFLLSGAECDEDCCEGDEDEEAEDDAGEEEEDPGEEDEEDDEESGEGDESSEEDDEEELDPDCWVSAGDLHDLKAVKTTAGSLEFEAPEDADSDDEDTVDVLVDGYHECTVTHVRRKGKKLEVRRADNGEWVTFNVTKYPSGWAKVLPLNELAEVEA